MDPHTAALADARPGQRWTVRHRLTDGSATDVVGWLDLLTPAFLHVGTPDGAVHVVERSRVVAARRAPAALGGPSPSRVSPEDLQHRTVPGWVALHEPLGEWTLRAGGGFTGRANSCHAVGDPGMPLDRAADRIVAYAAANAITPRAQTIAGSGEEAGLRALGWTDTDIPTDVLAARLSDLLTGRDRDPRVTVTANLAVEWWRAYHESRPNNADPALLRMILDGPPPRAFTGVADPDGDGLLSIGRGHLSGDWLGVASVWTRPAHRQQGWATAAIVSLGHWGARRGARYGYLQVDAANSGALTAYARLGFTRHHGYVYLTPGG